MKRLISTLRLDAILQFRNGFYYAAAFALVIFTLLVLNLPSLNWRFLLPPLILTNLMIGTFYFMSGLVLLEKGEGTLESLVVTPLGHREYLASKTITLSFLALLENTAIVFVAVGFEFEIFIYLSGCLATALIYSLSGFIAVARYDSINEFLFPSMLYVLFFSIPIVPYFGLWESPIFYLHPLQGPLILMKAGFGVVSGTEVILSLAASGFWILLSFHFAARSFYRFVIVREGAH